MFKFILIALIPALALAAGNLQNSDFATSAQITGAGGTNAQLLNTSKIWDSANAQLLDTTIAGLGTGNVAGPGVSIDGEIALFDGVSGALLKRATGSGFAKLTSGVLSTQSSPIPSADLNGGRTVNAQTGTTYTFALSDGSMAGGFPLVTLSNAAAITATVPTNASVAFPVGTQIDVTQLGAGAVTITPDVGVTVNTSASLTMSQYAGGTLVKTATDTWQFYAGGGSSSAITSLTGDVTATGPGAAAATIANLAVTNAKIANSTIDLTAKVTGILPNANTTATSANTNSAIVARDGSGNFSAGTITAALSGNASTSTALAANGSNCSAGQYPKGVDASGAAESCTAISLTADVSGVLPSANVGGGRTINAQTGTTYTFVLADGSGAGGAPLVTGSNAAAQTFTVPPNSSVAYPAGTQLDVCQLGAGKLTLAQGAGVTINSLSGNKAIGGQYVCVSLVRTASDVWLLTGNLIP
jgi:hypothetical protein